MARSGDVVCFDAGTYPTLEIANRTGTAAGPIVFRTVPGGELKATFTSGSLKHGHSVRVDRSEHVHLYDLRLTSSQTGIEVGSSGYARLDGLLVERVGQAAIKIHRTVAAGDEQRFLGPASHHCDVVSNTIRDTGRVTPRYGEGIYVGTGGLRGDDTHDVYVAYNHLDAVRAEAIEIKRHSHDVIVRGNLVTSGSHEFHAAITVAVQAKPDSVPNGHYLVEDNRIYNYASTGDSVAGITIGHGDTVVRNNVVWAIDGGRGIRTTTTFASASAREVVIEHNTIWTSGAAPSIALDDGDERTGITDHLGHVTVRDNVTSDGAAGSIRGASDDFVGPIEGSADAGQGPGTGFRAKRYAGLGADLDEVIKRSAGAAPR